MASWSTRRKFSYFFGFLCALILLAGIPIFIVFYEAPTCADGKQNGEERGVDCGGACPKLCPADFAEPKVLWSYSMRIAPEVYSAFAYVQNPNQAVEARSMPYSFKLYDKDGLFIAERVGRTFVPTGQKFAVFESGINTGKRVPTKTTFEFTDEPLWRPGNALTNLRIGDVILEQEGTPRAEVEVVNTSKNTSYSNVDAFIVLYDASGNRTAFSKTVIPRIEAGARETIYFTWLEAFPRQILRTEVLFVAKPSN